MHATRCGQRLVLVASAAFVALPATRIAAQSGEGDPGLPMLTGSSASAAGHAHTPVDVESRPMVSRFSVALLRPRRLLVEDDGRVIVADWGAGTVVEVRPEGQVTFLADGLDEPAGLARDRLGALYVSAHAGGVPGAGAIFRLEPGMSPVPVVQGLTGPTDLAFGPDGYLYVACFHEDSVLKVSPEDGLVMVAATVAGPAALAFDSGGVLYVASSTEGALFRVSSMGDVELVSRELHVPSDLAFDPHGHLIVANYGARELSYVDPLGRTRKFAVVPEGTIALDFDGEGNLFFVNWDGQYLMKVTTHFRVTCPHCGKAIPVRLREPPRETAPDGSTDPAGPMT